MNFNWKQVERKQTIQEEGVNSTLHIIASIFTFCALQYLIVLGIKRNNPTHFLGFLLYGSSLFFIYLMSTLYHGIQKPKIKKIFERLDYIAVFFVIAGTYSPFILILLQNQKTLSWGLFAFIWIMALLNSVITVFFVKTIGIINLLVYTGMGLMSVILIPTLYQIAGMPIIMYTALGGIVYIIGIYFYAIAKFRYHHAIWHILVFVASLIHFFTIITFI